MIKYAFLATGLLLTGALTVHAALAQSFDGERPAVQTADRLEWAWDGGDHAGIAVPATVHYQAGGAPRVIVRGPADLLARVRFDHGELRLTDSFFGFHGGERLDVTLIGMTLHTVGLAGHVDMDMGEIHQDRLGLSIAGSGQVEASGNADTLSLRIAGSGDYRLGKLDTHSMNISIAGSGQVDAASPQNASVAITGSGNVRFAAMPANLASSITGSGRISDAQGHVITRHG